MLFCDLSLSSLPPSLINSCHFFTTSSLYLHYNSLEFLSTKNSIEFPFMAYNLLCINEEETSSMLMPMGWMREPLLFSNMELLHSTRIQVIRDKSSQIHQLCPILNFRLLKTTDCPICWGWAKF